MYHRVSACICSYNPGSDRVSPCTWFGQKSIVVLAYVLLNPLFRVRASAQQQQQRHRLRQASSSIYVPEAYLGFRRANRLLYGAAPKEVEMQGDQVPSALGWPSCKSILRCSKVASCLHVLPVLLDQAALKVKKPGKERGALRKGAPARENVKGLARMRLKGAAVRKEAMPMSPRARARARASSHQKETTKEIPQQPTRAKTRALATAKEIPQQAPRA